MRRVRALWLMQFLALSAAVAGTETSAIRETPISADSSAWYRTNEWNVSVWSTLAFVGNLYPSAQNDQVPSLAGVDRYIETDHGWGGGLSAKYFLSRYFGLG